MKCAGTLRTPFSVGGLIVLLTWAFAGHTYGHETLGYAYVVTGGIPGSVWAYTIHDNTGILGPVNYSTFPTGDQPSSMAVDPTGNFAYVANRGSNDVWAYTIDSTTGALAPVGGSPFGAGTNPASVAVDPSGKFIYVANEGSNNVSAYSIDNSTGALAPVGGSPFGAGTNPTSVAVDPSGKFAYVTNYNSYDVWAYTIDSITGALSSIGLFATGAFPTSIAVEPLGRYAYVIALDYGFGIWGAIGYSIDNTTGALTLIDRVFPSPNQVPDNYLAIDPSSKHIYMASGRSVAMFDIRNQDGYLLETGWMAPTGGPPVSITTTKVGSMVSSEPLFGCVGAQGEPLVGATVGYKQKGGRQTTTTDPTGCYGFQGVDFTRPGTITIDVPALP